MFEHEYVRFSAFRFLHVDRVLGSECCVVFNTVTMHMICVCCAVVGYQEKSTVRVYIINWYKGVQYYILRYFPDYKMQFYLQHLLWFFHQAVQLVSVNNLLFCLLI